ncbi:AraC family transcriptional regulator [Mycobacterium intermedium]|uniref:AraC family transcriptional regulator n=1 Tax=Mycobacterium intermedium TaxID=28445 RepID=A0A1E3SGF8_MYCIE|nr:GlxA family transcriptional regulator [Mycobacterium intermedium]MCV6963059.1 GlxA family transcriptional regulator [Mycobacterium intermedium]ODR00658.1 transcriptional regulator [Mycobacterium intermedium]OPE52277.1 AraC family transcriptional regulator [Mycobacterium intermedium]ORB00284.1 AraC family transcriptional regulator [Mycobacterium intermedium]
MPRKVVIVGFPGVQSLDVVGPYDVFTGASMLTNSGYDVVVGSLDGQPITTPTGLAFVSTPLPDPSDVADGIDTVIVPGGAGVDAARTDAELLAWIKAVADTARRVVTVCTGAFLAAEAGLLDGCRVTTHWAFADRLAREFPGVDVNPDPIFMRSSEKVWTAAGVTSGIDLALSLIEDDHGTEVAQTVARWLVLYLRRPGGQTQFAAPVWMPRAKRPSIREVQEAIEAQPGGSHSIEELAQRAAMSPRHFTRVFTEEVGEAPGQYVERIRTEAARRQLEETDDTVVAIAARCGFGTAETMRRNFIRRIGISPDQYRKAFA